MALFTAKVTARGGRAGHITSDDGVLDFDIVMPNAKKEGETGTNPEQLFAAGYLCMLRRRARTRSQRAEYRN